MNSIFFEDEIEFFAVKGTNLGKIAWTSDGKFEEISIVALNWQSWLDENHDSKKYLTLCKELAKALVKIQEISNVFDNDFYILSQIDTFGTEIDPFEPKKTNFAQTKTVKQLINGNVLKRGVLPFGWTSSSIGVSYQKCYG